MNALRAVAGLLQRWLHAGLYDQLVVLALAPMGASAGEQWRPLPFLRIATVNDPSCSCSATVRSW